MSGSEELITPMMLTHQFSVACINRPAQYAAVSALEGSKGGILRICQRKRVWGIIGKPCRVSS